MCCSASHHNQPQTSHELVDRRWGDDGWCICPGADDGMCCGYATAADGLCDRCRKHCKAPAEPAELAATQAAELEPAPA